MAYLAVVADAPQRARELLAGLTESDRFEDHLKCARVHHLLGEEDEAIHLYEEMGERFNVNIAGYALTVTTERSAEHMERLSALLNEKVREVQKSGGTANYLHVIMLAAMKLGDEILEVRGELEKEKQRFEEKSQDLLTVLDKALK